MCTVDTLSAQVMPKFVPGSLSMPDRPIWRFTTSPVWGEFIVWFQAAHTGHLWSAGEFVCVGGTNSTAILCTSDGTVLSTLASCSSWVWCVCAHPKKNCIAVGSEDGSIAVYQLIFSTVHGLYHDRYAFRYSSMLGLSMHVSHLKLVSFVSPATQAHCTSRSKGNGIAHQYLCICSALPGISLQPAQSVIQSYFVNVSMIFSPDSGWTCRPSVVRTVQRAYD